MAYNTPYTFIALQALTASQMNGIQDNIRALWPYTTAGDISYASAAGVLARLAKGTAGQVLKINTGATAPEWANNLYGAKIDITGAQNVNNNYWTTVSFNGTVFDNASMFSVGTPTRLTFTKSGTYLIGVNVSWSTSTGDKYIEVFYDGISILGCTSPSPAALPCMMGKTEAFPGVVSGKYLEMKVWQNSGSPQNILEFKTNLWAIML